MQRSKKIVIICHCILNSNAKVKPLASYPGVLLQALQEYLQNGTGFMQLPCPESAFLGLKRWGMSIEQYDTLAYRRHCKNILQSCLDTLHSFIKAEYEILGIVGADGSPNCGVHKVPVGYTGGVLDSTLKAEQEINNLQFTTGMGILMQELKFQLDNLGISIPFMAIDEHDPSTIISK
jgi:predicted secreted protein